MDRYTIISTADKLPLLHTAQIDSNEGYYCIYNDFLVEQSDHQAKVNALQAKIDALMWEYCHEDMTTEQIVNYSNHQKAVELEQDNEP